MWWGKHCKGSLEDHPLLKIDLTSWVSKPTLENVSYAQAYCALSGALLQECYDETQNLERKFFP